MLARAVRALVLDVSLVKYLAAKALGPRVRRAFYGPGTCFDVRDVPAPSRPADDWLLLRPRLTGLCGSDVSAVFFKFSPATSAFSIGPGERAVLGHEVLADVVEVGPGARGAAKEGDRVVVDPFLGCAVRGEPPCPGCARGDDSVCTRIGTSRPRGISLGFCSAWPGGFGERMVAHAAQVFRVPDALPDEAAVLAEPLSVAVHAVLRHPPRDGERVLVLGGGMIAFAVTWALRELHPSLDVTLFTIEDWQKDAARAVGATAVWTARDGRLLDLAARATGASVLRPPIGGAFLAGGFDRVFDCVGSHRSVSDSMRIAAGGATIVLVGAPGVLPSLDWTFVWQKELRVEGTSYYAHESWRGGRARTFAATLELMTTTRAPLASLLTHRFGLEDYARSLDATIDRGAHRSVKVALSP